MQGLFQSLDSYLITQQEFWRFEPFFACRFSNLPWQEQHPQLCLWLTSLTDQQVEQYQSDLPALANAVRSYIPNLPQLLALNHLERVELKGLPLERGIDAGIPGRKLAQIVAMGEVALEQHAGSEWLEWCSGKGFLGRILAHNSQQTVTSFEFQQSLCDSGQQEANKQHLPMHFVQGDALSPSALDVLNSNQHAVALHACGDLHVSLIEKGVERSLPAFTISPCCYHLIQAETYQPLSKPAQASQLHLTKSELRIPLQELVTGGERVRRHRMLEMSYRLGFDALLTDCFGFEHYQPIPSIKKSQLAEGFESFCYWAAQLKGIALTPCDFDKFYHLGQQRYWKMERLSLIQQLFRRSLELWLVLDKVLYLQQHGYDVSISEFCAREVTPRNILIKAKKKRP